MAAVMLAGAPLCNEAYAATTYSSVVATKADVKLENGVKFLLQNTASSEVMKAKPVTVDDVTYMAYSNDATAEKAVFEVVNYQKGLLGVTFELKVNGKTFAANKGGEYCTIFTATFQSGAKENTLGNIDDFFVLKSDGSVVAAFEGYNTATESLDYDAAELETFNKKSTTFSFGEGVEGNIFSSLTPFTVGGKTYFLSGAKKDVDAFKGSFTGTFDDAIKAAAKKISIAAVTVEKWGLNTKADAEGYKLALVNGEAFYGDKKLDAKNAGFKIVEGDQLNKEGEIVLSATVKVSDTVTAEDVIIASVKASGSDTKTYVTTVNSNNSHFQNWTNPTLGDNTYFAASEFLKAGEVSAYNIYITSGTPATAATTNYHKYFAAARKADYTAYENTYKAAKDVDLTNPAAQWIATGFNGKYTLTLQNRLTNETIDLNLTATDNAGEYAVSGTSDLADKRVKLLPTTLTKYDGSLELSEEQMEEGVTLSFSGKNASIGEQTFYPTVVNNGDETTPNYALVPTLDASNAAKFAVTRLFKDKKDEAVNITPYAYLDAAGAVVTADKAKADTLIVPAYKYTIDINKVNYTVTEGYKLKKSADVAAADYVYNWINKLADGSYTTTYTNASSAGYATHKNGRDAIAVKAITDKDVKAEFYTAEKNYYSPADASFANLGVDINDNFDYASLPAVSRHATFEAVNVAGGGISMQESKNGILEGILNAEPATFWLDTADSESNVPTFYISKGIKAAEETKAYSDEVRNFLVYAKDSLNYFDEASATLEVNEAYQLEGTTDLKAFFHPAALVAEDTMTTVADGKEVVVVAKKTKAGQIEALKNFQFGIRLFDEDVADEYVIYSKAAPSKYLYSHNGKLGFGTKAEALVVKLGEGDATANEAIAAENNVAVIAGEGVVTVKGAAGKQVVVSNILGQEIANKVATSDEETIAVAAGVVVVRVDGEATKVVVK